MADIPHHLEMPLRLTASGDFAEVEQDSDVEITQCARAVLASPVGRFTDLPDFGTPPRALHQASANERGAGLEEIERCLHQWEPRIDPTAARGAAQGLIDEIVIQWKRAAHGG